MSMPEPSSSPDPPFPGAHPQVPGAHADRADTLAPASGPRRLPLEASPTRAGQGWAIRLPVRAEDVSVGKQVVVRERVVLRRRAVGDVSHQEVTVRREELRVDDDDARQVDVAEPASDAPAGPRRAAEG